MKRWQKVFLASSVLMGGCGSGLLWLYAEQLDDGHEAMITDQVEVVTVGPDGRITTQKVPRKFLPPNPRLAGQHVVVESPPADPAVATEQDRFSTFAVDVDTASYTQAKRRLREGYLPGRETVRVEEFVNYFRYDYPQPSEGAFSVSFDGAPSPFDVTGTKHLLRIGLQGKRIEAAVRKPIHLTLLVDVSGSMGGADRLDLAKRSLTHLVKNLEPTDTVAIATYAGATERVLEPTSAHSAGTIIAAIHRLQAGGGTAMSDGLGLAYGMAMQSFVAGHENRVVVISDGDANVGATSHDQILGEIQHYVDEGVTLSTIGFGVGNYRDQAMEQLANKGNGNNYYVGSMDDARRIFGEDLGATLVTIAKDVKVQVEFDPAKVASYRLIGYENRRIADHDFRNDAVDAGEIGAGHSVTALYEIELIEGAFEELATVRIRHKTPTGHQASELAFSLDRRDLADRLDEGSDDLRFAAGVAEFAELLRGSPHAAGLTFATVSEVIAPVKGAGRDRNELAALVEQAAALEQTGYRSARASN